MLDTQWPGTPPLSATANFARGIKETWLPAKPAEAMQSYPIALPFRGRIATIIHDSYF